MEQAKRCRLLAIVLVATVMLAVLPGMAFAEPTEGSIASDPVQSFLNAVNAIAIPDVIDEQSRSVLNEQIGASQAAYEALDAEALAREDIQQVTAFMQAAMNALTDGTETMASFIQPTYTVYMQVLLMYDKEE